MRTVSRVGGSDYADYLNLELLLQLQHPRCSRIDRWVHGDEHFFIVVHQCSELMLRQILIDLKDAGDAMTPPSDGDLRWCIDNLKRSAESLRLLGSLMSALHFMRVKSFASFRPLLGKASGAQSSQFRELRLVLGLSGNRDGALFDAFRKLVSDRGCELGDVFSQLDVDHVLHRIAEAMLNLSEAVWQCLTEHVRLAAWMLGDAAGTGGSSGVGYLEKRIAAPFEPLWRARSVAHVGGA
ncbi:tryptophan 2,3-dioxygenase family protein [Micromonospora fulviviridis]|uniref:Tryptophan 2,3-dioxygenase family protein n=1 Tax=Micromonospora fulviviridis TaxID=47860 RepID=A0ABV2VW12_9ACTN